jgi:hypothetical protein
MFFPDDGRTLDQALKVPPGYAGSNPYRSRFQ